MQIDHGRPDVGVPEKLLDRAEIVTGLEKTGIRAAKGVGGYPLHQLAEFSVHSNPKFRTWRGGIFHFVASQLPAVYQGTIYLHSVSTIIRNLVAALQHFINKQCRIVTVRIGRPFLTIMIQERYGEPQLKDRVPLESIEPTSYLLRDDGLCSVEHDVVLPQKSADWIFPKRLSVAESPWACWYNKHLDCCFMLQIARKLKLNRASLSKASKSFVINGCRTHYSQLVLAQISINLRKISRPIYYRPGTVNMVLMAICSHGCILISMIRPA